MKHKIDALVEKYHSWRNEIWLDIPEELEQLKYKNFNLNHLLTLDGLESPFIKGGNPTRSDALLFLWIISEEYNYNQADRDKYFQKLGSFNLNRLVLWIKEYLERAFGESDTLNTGKKSQTYFVAYFVDCIAREYGWQLEQILNTPIGILFQLITAINERNSLSSGKEYKRVTELDNQINRYILNSNSNNAI